MQVARADLALAAGGVDKKLVYATGGWSNQMLCNVEVYSSMTDLWNPLPALLEPRAAHASCIFTGAGGIKKKGRDATEERGGGSESLYVFCGVSREKNLSTIEMLNLSRHTQWKEVHV